MPDKQLRPLMHAEAETADVSPIYLPGEHLEIFGGSVEEHLNKLLEAHVATSRELKSAIAAQHAVSEIMDNAVRALRDPNLPVEEAIRQMTHLLSLEKKVGAEREALQKTYDAQMAEYQLINDEMERIAREHPERFVLSSEINE